MRKHKRLALIAIGCLILAVLTGFTVNPVESLKTNYLNKTEKEVISELSKKPISDITDEINTISSFGADLSDITIQASVLAKRADEIDDDTLVSIIKDNKNSQNLRVTMLQLGKHKKSFSSNEGKKILIDLLKDNKEEFAIKQNAIWALPDDDPLTIEVLTEISKQESDGALAFQAIRKLNLIKPNLAIDLSNDILADYHNQQTEKVRAAIKVKAKQFSNEKEISKEKNQFTQMCFDIFNTSDDQIMKDTVIFAVSELKDEATITNIVRNEKIDRPVKAYCIDQNYSTLLRMIKNNPTDENIETVIQAMNIYPIKDLLSPLKEAIDKSDSKNNFSKLVEQEANPVNEKWLD
ncbi:hypothetical protein [Dehalobacter sp. 14DCB1]|uniref:hypothetical protein n=1 Tax=Dehalobacter sp. 14DCB1 TaxID=2070227 RepID=UPI001047F0D9|nr:hypothetical protein [Dehalobacter sp. 14DCB1]TCX48939.1 hypothetical protein C1I36_12825 [Dehalobacter sp. 14DCB1]